MRLDGRRLSCPTARLKTIEDVLAPLARIRRGMFLAPQMTHAFSITYCIWSRHRPPRGAFRGPGLLSLRWNRRINHAIHMTAIIQIRNRHSDSRAYYGKKVAEGKTRKRRSATSNTASGFGPIVSILNLGHQ